MPQIPDLNSLGTVTAQPGRNITTFNGGQSAKAVAEFGEAGIRSANNALENQDKLEHAYAKSNLLQGIVAAKSELENDPDYTTYEKRFGDKVNELVGQSSGLITSEAQKRLFLSTAGESISTAYNDIREMARKQEKNYGEASLLEIQDKNKNAALSAPDEKTRESLLQATQDAISGAQQRGYITPQEAVKQRIAFAQNYATARAGMLSPEEQVKLLKPAAFPSDANSAINFVIDKFEGSSLVPHDGNKGASKFGINQSANPEVDVSNLTREQAMQVYKTKYWDAIGADSLPQGIRLAAFDTAVNFGVGKAKAMIEQSNGDPRVLASIRQAEHNRLIQSDPDTYGKYQEAWAARDQAIADNDTPYFPRTNTWVDYIPPEEKLKLSQRAEIRLRQQEAQAQREQKQMLENQARALSVQKVISGTPLDPKNKNDREALNNYFDQSLTQWQESGADQQTMLEHSVEFATQRGMIPDGLQTIIRSGLRGGDADQATIAADTVRRIRNGNPRALTDMPDSDIRLAEHMGALTDAGFKPQEAFTRAIEAEQRPPAYSEVRKKEFDKAVKDSPSRNYIASELNSFFSRDPIVPALMEDDFNRAAEAEYQRTGNMDSARTVAMNTVRRVWNRSKVGGEYRYMKNAPEVVYGAPGLTEDENSEWMNEQLLDDLRENALIDPDYPIEASNVRILPNPTSGEQPTYYVSVMDKDGVEHTQLDANGQFLQWQPSWVSSKMYLKKQVEQQNNVESARTERRMNAVR